MGFILKSAAFKNNSLIPEKYTCDGEDISPEFEWINPPKGTKSFTLMVNDYDAPGGIWTHWIVYNIPFNLTSLSEGICLLPKPAKIGFNSWKQKRYGGPCPPQSMHNYYFDLYALDDWLKLRGRATRNSIEKAITHHLLCKATLVGVYQKKHSNTLSKKAKIDPTDAATVLRRKKVNPTIKEKAEKELKSLELANKP